MSVLAAAAVATAAATAAAAHPSAPSPPAAPWAAPGVSLECQAKLNAFCNDPDKDGPHNDGAYNASRAPFFGLFDHNGAPDGTYRAVATSAASEESRHRRGIVWLGSWRQ